MGNDGPGGPSFGSVSGPGGAPAALTVGAVDLRRRHDTVRVVVRHGLDVLLDRRLPLGGAVAPAGAVDLEVVVPKFPPPEAARAGRAAAYFFDRRGFSLVAGQAALVPAGTDPEAAVEGAAAAGARAVLLYGSVLPPGGFGLQESVPLPVVGIPAWLARDLARRVGGRGRVRVTLGRVRQMDNPSLGRVAGFSSTGLAFDGRVKPDLVAPGVALPTSDAGANEDGSPRYGTVNGSSAAAAVVAAAAALLAEARPALDADGLKSVLVGAARPIAGEALTSQGAGVLDLGASAAAEVGAQPTTLALGRASGDRWKVRRELLVRSLSTRPLAVRLHVDRTAEGAAAIRFTARPARFLLPAGATVRVRLRAELTSQPRGTAPAEGVISIEPSTSAAIRVPWVISFDPPPTSLLESLHLSQRAFAPSDAQPALLTFDAGSVRQVDRADARRTQIAPIATLDVVLWTASGRRIGLLARLRDLLPGRYQFGLTGRDVAGSELEPGEYEVRLIAYPTLRGAVTRRVVRFTIK